MIIERDGSIQIVPKSIEELIAEHGRPEAASPVETEPVGAERKSKYDALVMEYGNNRHARRKAAAELRRKKARRA